MEPQVNSNETNVKYEPQFVQGVMNLPVVNSVAEKVSEAYTNTKEYNSYIKYSLETAENLVKYGADSAKPLVNKLEKPIAAVDSFAYDQLKKVENSYPIITKPTDEIIQTSIGAFQEAKDYGVSKVNLVKNYGYETVENVKTYSYDKVQTVKNYGSEKMTAAMESDIGKDVIHKVEEILTLTEKYLDNVMPPSECQSTEVFTTETVQNNVQRLAMLSIKAHARLRCLAVQHLEKLKVTAESKLEELKAVLICLKEKTASSAKNYNERVQNLWLELNKESGDGDAQTWQEKLLQKARIITKSLSHIFKQTSSVLTYVSTRAKQRFVEATEQADNLYGLFKVASAGEITDVVISRAQENLQKLQEVIGSLANLKFFPLSKQVQDVLTETTNLTELPTDSASEKSQENKQEDN